MIAVREFEIALSFEHTEQEIISQQAKCGNTFTTAGEMKTPLYTAHKNVQIIQEKTSQ